MKYDLEIKKAVQEIKRHRAKLVCIQLPDGLRPYANKIHNELEAKTGATILIWLGSCFGACDVPYYLEKLGVDLLIQWGHEAFSKD